MTKIIREYPNSFNLPKRIEGLARLAHNLWWAWNPDGQRIYSHIDPLLWNAVNHNPIAFLRRVDRTRINAALNQPSFLVRYDKVIADLDAYVARKDTWFTTQYPKLKDKNIAYFSFEFGLHESLPVYAGGLGILSGDHLKEASDLGLPLTAVGFVYNQGYFVQHLTEDGWQETRSALIDYNELPLVALLDENRQPLTICVDLPGRDVTARIWELEVGRIHLYMLDTNLEQNSPADRQLTERLYNSDPEIRISQEVLLGIGGVRVLQLLGIYPDVWHMNEGHSAFLSVERLRGLVTSGLSLDDAIAKVRIGDVFTTHTPVPAGNDQFPLWLIDKYFAQIWTELGMTRDQFIDLGRQAQPWGETFVMPVLALKLSERANAVSELHGQVSRKMWSFLWPNEKVENVPIGYVTNGVHTGTWLARRMGLLFSKYLGKDWIDRLDDQSMWENVVNIPDHELWEVRRHLKNKLVNFANERTRLQWRNGTLTASQVVAGGVFLEPYSLTIGFARRFATYKRANLMFRDFDRLMKLINHPHMPVQIIFAGKAHPADEPGKLIIQQVYRAVKESRSGGRLIFLEDYDINLARYLVQGVDVWMNTPRRPNEASGTSGMKAALNGGLNFSILDGWWREGFNNRNGWSIGSDTEYTNPEEQDAADAQSIYETLENQIIPLFYERDADSIPAEWLKMVKENMRTLTPQFSLRRMLKEYVTDYYLPSIEGKKRIR
ncbi:MAG: alpha-glucan phosphorylase [Chloroflexi bacterium HGW-Chloroflexi-4]|jgi:starch phosphorylase|nr:MAG: alpha-glucan phosphorylase [Chloroflexi bacterium HGW-Chloroflexi-4]